jgi:glutathione S-transferase
MKLIGAVTSPYVRKVRVVMAEKKLDYQFVTEDVWAAETTIAESNPLARCPVWSWRVVKPSSTHG